MINHIGDKEEIKRLKNYNRGFSPYKYTITVNGENKEIEGWDNLYIYNGMTVAEYIAKYYPIQSAVWFWSYNRQSFEINGQPLSINECIERYQGEVSDSTELLAVTCAVNGSEFAARGRGRFLNPDNTVEILNGRIVLTFVDKTDDMAGTPAYNNNYLYTDDDGYRVYESTSFIPNGWEDRLKLYEDLKDFLQED